MSTFLKAAASYYGFDEHTNVEWGTDAAGNLVLVARIPVDPDLESIVGCMARMRADAEALAQQPHAEPVLPSETRMRDEYSAMDKRTKSEFGSFSRYKAWRLGQVELTDEPSMASLPPYVYLSPAEVTLQQKAMAVGVDEEGNYAVAVEDLTEAQQHERGYVEVKDQQPIEITAEMLRAEYIERTVAARASLDGSDGKPTSNADDFGGLPG